MHQNYEETYDRKIVVFTGAGISVDSGVETFRDKNGLWEKFDINRVCNYDTWLNHYIEVHEFYNEVRKNLKELVPNDTHKKIKELQEKYGKERVTVITTNVDRFLDQVEIENVLYLHGKIDEIKSFDNKIINIGYNSWDYMKDDYLLTGKNPYKPNVVFFNEIAEHYEDLNNIFSRLGSRDIIVTIGASEQVVPVGIMISQYGGLPTRIRINPQKDYNIENLYDFDWSKNSSEGMDFLLQYLEDIQF